MMSVIQDSENLYSTRVNVLTVTTVVFNAEMFLYFYFWHKKNKKKQKKRKDFLFNETLGERDIYE